MGTLHSGPAARQAAWILLAALLAGCGASLQEVRTTFQRGVEAQRAYHRGQELAQADRHAEAIPHFRRALALQPDHDEAEADLGWSLYQTGQYAEAARHFRRGLARQPDWEGLHNGLGWSLYQQGQYPAALQAFQGALDLDPRYRDAALGRAYTLYEAGRYAEALPYLERLTREGEGHMLQSPAPDLEAVRSRYAWTLYYLGEYARARQEFQKGIAARPDWYGLHGGLGWTELKLGNRAAARQSFERALRLKPDDADARAGLAQAR